MATQMKAPPSTKKEIVDVPFNYRHLVDKYSPGGRYIDAQSDDDSPWVPFGLALHACRVDVGQRDLRPGLGHAFGIGEADPAGSAGDERGAAADVELLEGLHFTNKASD